MAKLRPAQPKWRQFEPHAVLMEVGWYLRYSLSWRDVEELRRERGLSADHTRFGGTACAGGSGSGTASLHPSPWWNHLHPDKIVDLALSEYGDCGTRNSAGITDWSAIRITHPACGIDSRPA